MKASLKRLVASGGKQVGEAALEGVPLANVDAETAVVTADHGELFGNLGLYSHPTGVSHPSLRRVSVETTATDPGRYEPHYDRPDAGEVDADTQELLERLGYR